MSNHFIGIEAHRQKVKSFIPKMDHLGRCASNRLCKGNKLNLSHLNQIVELGEGWVDVEPRITMEELVRSLFPLIPPVVPEFCSITVGGAVMGAALESSSWKYGQFNDCCLEYDLLLGNGELITVSREKQPDLFWGVSGSYGTIGILTRIRVRLIKAKRSIHLKMLEGDPVKIFDTLAACDFCDAVCFRKKRITMLGNFSDEAPSHFLRPHSPWFYQLLEEGEMVLPTIDYLFRFDRGAFWMGRYLLSMKMIGHAFMRNSPRKTVAKIDKEPGPLFRFLFGRACTSRLLYRALHTMPQKIIQDSFFIHDFYIPPEKVEIFLKKNQIFPIWLCPIKGTEEPQFLSPHFGKSRWINVGLYGPYQESLDLYCNELGGRKMLYSSTRLERSDFEKIYFEERYQELRKKFSAEKKFPHLYDKVKWNR